MKKKIFTRLFVVAATMGVVFTGCKKDKVTAPSATSTTATTAATIDSQAAKSAQGASDLSSVEMQSDASMDDINAILNNSSLRSIAGPCNVTIDTSQRSAGTITIDYNGLSCDLRKRLSGSISIQLAVRGGTVTNWGDVGATVGITYTNFKVTNVADSSSITFNGSYNVTNVIGGNVFLLTSGDSVVHKVRGEMQITFPDNTTRTWGVSRTRTFRNQGGLTNILGSLSVTITGDTTINGNSNVSRWGTNRADEAFSVSITTPITVKAAGSICIFKQITGEKVYRRADHTLSITHGVDANGVVVTDGSCTYGYKIVWTDDQGATQEVVRPYWF